MSGVIESSLITSRKLTMIDFDNMEDTRMQFEKNSFSRLVA